MVKVALVKKELESKYPREEYLLLKDAPIDLEAKNLDDLKAKLRLLGIQTISTSARCIGSAITKPKAGTIEQWTH